MMAWTRELLKPETFAGAVFAAIIGTAATAVLAWVFWNLHAAYRRHSALSGAFSDEPLDEVADKRFPHGHPRARIHEGAGRRICVGVLVNSHDLHLRTLNIRPLERRRLRLRNLTKPYALDFKKIVFRQVDLEQRGYSVSATMNPWPDEEGGFTCQLRGDNFVLEVGAKLWCEIEADANREWEGVISFQGKLKGTDVVLCRCPISIVGDHNRLN